MNGESQVLRHLAFANQDQEQSGLPREARGCTHPDYADICAVPHNMSAHREKLMTKRHWLYLATLLIVPGGLFVAAGHFLYNKFSKQHRDEEL